MVDHDDVEPGQEPTSTEHRLLAIIADLVRETQPQRDESEEPPSLDSRLDRDLGLDSLARAELLLRLESAFGVRLPESALLAETPAALLERLHGARGVEGARSGEEQAVPLSAAPPGPDATQGEPRDAETLNQVLDWHLAQHPDRTHLILYGDDDIPTPLSYAELDRGARAIAAALVARGLQSSDRVALMLPTQQDYFLAFFGILRAGAVPVPIYPPARPTQLAEHLRRHGRILTNAGARLLITVPEARRLAHLLRAEAPALGAILTLAELSGADGARPLPAPRAASLGLLQYTSGSTGDPKGVTLTHAQLLANIRAMGERLEATPQDRFVSWLPLYHDMGLIGAWLGSLYYGIPLVAMSPLGFLARPLRWLELIHRHRATLSGGPNFGYELCLRSLTPERLEGLDLSSWRVAFNGAEPVSPRTMQRFAEALEPHGLRREALMPVYGLAESAVGLCLSSPGHGLRLDRVSREAFTTEQTARPAKEGEPSLTFVDCGPPLPGYALRVVDAQGRELPERREGEIEFRGPSATTGYFDNPEASAALYHGDWLRTGDRGYLADGELYISGRVKDMLVRSGRNLYPYDLEEAVGRIEGVRKGCVAVFGDPDPESGTEALVVVAETRARGATQRERIRQAIRDASLDIVDLPPDVVCLVPPHSVLKTSSGKIRRAATAERYRSGRLGRRSAPMWRQLTGLALRSALRHAGMRLRWLGTRLYAGYAWGLFGFAALLLLPALFLPRLAWRWRVAHWLARGAARLAGLRIERHGVSRFPRDGPCVLVANHASYLDALVLTAVLPQSFCYLAKRELARHRAVRFVLRRMGALFVERFDPRQATRDTERIVGAVQAGHCLAIFPEGTFRAEPGLDAFHMGAFVVAAQTGVPVVPVALAGTRARMRGSEWLPRPGRVGVHIGEPLRPGSDDWAEAVRLRDAARAEILAACEEPDLTKT